MNTKIIAFYLPQFHPFKENDEWWGKGFTEWTNVGKAKSLFRGHQQPKVPADLGYYDLRLPEVRNQQVELAKSAGIYGFCYWHYWFGNGVQLMNRIIDEVHSSESPDFPFCLGWANESWKAKQWNKDGSGDKILVEQTYPDIADFRKHYEYVRELFKDKRYIRYEGKPFFYIYKPLNSPAIKQIILLWNQWIKEDGIADGIYFVANLDFERDFDKVSLLGFNAYSPANLERIDNYYHSKSLLHKLFIKLKRNFQIGPTRIPYSKACNHIWNANLDFRDDFIPFLIPNWDHTPRSGRRGRVLTGSTPTLFEEQAEHVLGEVQKKKQKFVMLKSWNEWAEGNYMEPDLVWGHGYIDALKKAIEITTK